jgi:hypothetical protein
MLAGQTSSLVEREVAAPSRARMSTVRYSEMPYTAVIAKATMVPSEPLAVRQHPHPVLRVLSTPTTTRFGSVF